GLDTIVEAAWEQPGVLGARMTGAGFGGCAIALVAKNQIDAFKENVNALYQQAIGYAATFYTATIGDGAKETELPMELNIETCTFIDHPSKEIHDQRSAVNEDISSGWGRLYRFSCCLSTYRTKPGRCGHRQFTDRTSRSDTSKSNHLCRGFAQHRLSPRRVRKRSDRCGYSFCRQFARW